MSESPAPEQTQDPRDTVPQEKVVYLHGFDRQELFALVDIIKKNVENPRSIAFATSTKNNLEMKVKELIVEVRSDHDYMSAQREAAKARKAQESRQETGQETGQEPSQD